jgi:hypothetical protein
MTENMMVPSRCGTSRPGMLCMRAPRLRVQLKRQSAQDRGRISAVTHTRADRTWCCRCRQYEQRQRVWGELRLRSSISNQQRPAWHAGEFGRRPSCRGSFIPMMLSCCRPWYLSAALPVENNGARSPVSAAKRSQAGDGHVSTCR